MTKESKADKQVIKDQASATARYKKALAATAAEEARVMHEATLKAADAAKAIAAAKATPAEARQAYPKTLLEHVRDFFTGE